MQRYRNCFDVPSLKLQVVLEEEMGTVALIFFQDPQMLASFDRFPEIILMETNTNNQDMSLYTLLTIDGNGESQVAASYLVQKDETSV